MKRTVRHPRWCVLAGGCGLLLALVAGCGPGKGTVSGQVLFGGKPLPGGVVMFRPVDTKHNPVTDKIDENGKYEVTVPAGECLISVDNRALKGGGVATGPVGIGGGGTPPKTRGGRGGPITGPPKDAMAKMSTPEKPPDVTLEKPVGTYVEIPAKFYSPEESGLKYTVKRGSQTHDIELK